MNNPPVQGINVLFGSPFIYSPPPPQNPSTSNQKKPQIQNIQISQMPVGAQNIAYPVIPMVYPQQGIYSNQPLFFSNGFIPNQQSQIIYYQVVDGKLAPLPQVNFVPINQAPIAVIKNINENNEKNSKNENKNEIFTNKNININQNINAVPVQIMQMQNINQNTNNFQINQPLIQGQNGVIINSSNINNLQNNKNELFIPKEASNEIKEQKKVEKKVIFNLNNINKTSPKVRSIKKKNINNNSNMITNNDNKKNLENINSNTQNINKNLIDNNLKKESINDDNKEILNNPNIKEDNESKEISNINNNIISTNNNIINNIESSEQKDINDNNNLKNINNINNDINNQIEKQTKSKTKYYRCTFKDCNKVFPKECNLKDHIRTHTGEKPYKCSYPGCHKSFSQHGNLKKHEKVHIGDKKYYCTYPNCGKKFSASYNLKIHYRCHTGERPYKCCFPGCLRSFYDKGNLKYHEKTMHLAESMEFPFSCEHMGCNAKFKTEKEKLEHHCKMEPDCLTEREELIKLVQKYKILMNRIIKDKNIDINKNEVITNLKKEYEEIQSKLIDNNLFVQYLGDNFESECKNIEKIINEENNNDIENNKDNNNNEENKNLENIKEDNEDNKIDEEKDNLNLINEENNENKYKEIINEIECDNDENKNDNIEINKSE